MALGRMLALFGLAVGMILTTDGRARADEVMPPDGSKVTIGTPTVTATTIRGSGDFTVPDGWHKAVLDPVQLRIYKVNDKGGKDVFYKGFDGSTMNPNLWDAVAKGLTPDTEYWVEVRFKFVKDGTLDYAYREASAGKIRTNKQNIFDESTSDIDLSPPPP